MAQFEEGNTFSTGRPKGSKNKLNTDIKEAFDLAFQGIGGAKALTEWAQSHKSSFFKIYASMHPRKLQATVENTQENFVFYIQEEERRKLEEAGKPVKMIECSGDEISKEENNTT